MPLVRRIQRRGSNIVVEAHGEVLFAATGDVGRWTNRFSQRARAFAAAEAPTNKRPRWGHYGKPLKETFTASTTYQPNRMRVYSAMGSSSPHAWYVDQGTGIYNQSSPWQAKILPPTEHGAGNLYERTWRAGGPSIRNRPSRPIWIKGQKGQGFFDTGLRRAFQSMRMRAFQTPGDPKITNALNSVPTGLTNFAGNTPADGAFLASLNEWRAWRDAAYKRNEDFRTGASRVKPAKPPKVKATVPTSPTKPSKPRKLDPAQREAIRDRVAAALRAQGRDFRNLTIKSDGTWTALVKQGNIFKPTKGRWRK